MAMDDCNYPALQEKTDINEDVGIIRQKKAPPVSSKEYPRRLLARTGRRSARMSTTIVEHVAAELTMSPLPMQRRRAMEAMEYSGLRGEENTTRGKDLPARPMKQQCQPPLHTIQYSDWPISLHFHQQKLRNMLPEVIYVHWGTCQHPSAKSERKIRGNMGQALTMVFAAKRRGVLDDKYSVHN
ncbi:hypothetical protein CPC08DRAFT_729181 [Agrocybe pediades]|nr:hypothetical protein CPC08DRAFT_729181 [Agrocybe pediades]